MKLHTLYLVLLSTLIFTLNGCGGGSSSTSTSVDPTNPTKPTKPTTMNPKVNITDEYQVESLGIANTINATVSLGSTPKDLYLVLSNYDTNSFPDSTITHNAKVSEEEVRSKSISPASFTKKSHIRRAPQYVKDFSSKITTLLSKVTADQPQAKTIIVPERNEDMAGTQNTFCVNINNNGSCTSYSNATARKVIPNVDTNFGSKTLNIWVSDNSFGTGCGKLRCVTQDMVDQLAATFLTKDLDNDIYDWVTNIYEEEWGSDARAKYSNMIPDNDEITIFLTDIDENNSPNGGVIGFFWSKDNFKTGTVSGSNERLMFYADAVMFANGEDDWDIDDFWPKEMVSTLAHEFQHMIHFYQKTTLLADDTTDTWVEEMLSETTEDIIATKIQHIGPRGVDYLDGSAGETGNTNGRYPLFNENNTLSLTGWSNRLEDYSNVNAFGTYLIRNYGGAKLLHDIMHNTYTDKQAIVDAVNKSAEGSGKTFDNLLSEWGTAVLLSNIESPENLPTYNTGDFTYNTYKNTTYDMGSINFFNYDPLPTIYTTAGTVQAQGNYYYKVGSDLTGDITINLELNGQTEATLIAK